MKKKEDLETLIILGFKDKEKNSELYDKHKDFNEVVKILLEEEKKKIQNSKKIYNIDDLNIERKKKLLKELKFIPNKICEKMLKDHIKFGEIVDHCLSYKHLNVLPLKK
jgi:hypothetical protein